MSTIRQTTLKVTPSTKFAPVFHKNGHRIAGLWQRGSRFYAQLRIHEGGVSRATRIPLRSATTVAQAVEQLNEAKLRRNKGELTVHKHAPNLSKAIDLYKQSAEFMAKRESSRVNEMGYFKRWAEKLGHVRVDRLQKEQIIGVRDGLHAEGRHIRTCNLYVMALMQVLKFCRDRGHIPRLPEVRRLKPPKAARQEYLSDELFQQLLENCRPEVNKNAPLMRYYLRFLALTGAREQEATRIAWRDVNFKTSRLAIGSDGKSKNHEARDLDMSDELIDLLKEMEAQRPPDSQWLFPSPQRGNKDLHVRNFRACLNDVRGTPRGNCRRDLPQIENKLPQVGFHTLRHLFISKCVMAGIPYMTIAEWVGHKDGGILIGSVYGHLSQDHKADMARKLSLFKKPENVITGTQKAAG